MKIFILNMLIFFGLSKAQAGVSQIIIESVDQSKDGVSPAQFKPDSDGTGCSRC
ncbi:hypothetical protein [Peredibacter starrii]|uniref:Uncharacterized protein n=1 Tax=Peredibacter starrii TaxID=28202 RepID=A0AAX4HRC1_9BACT|nr:hypothetical protein [Peredibacter starrii]WPU65856.1 hypothetical protein SOO65_03770 [Peredibacter starrii]